MVFRSYCIVSVDDARRISSLIHNDNIISFQPDPTKRFWQTPDGTGLSTWEHGEKDRKPVMDEVPRVQ